MSQDQLAEVAAEARAMFGDAPHPDALLMSVPHAATLLGIGPSTLRGMVADREIPSVKIKGRRMIRRADLDAYVEGLEAA